MHFHTKSVDEVLKSLNTDKAIGLRESEYKKSREKFGKNLLKKKPKKPLIKKIGEALSEPMLIILIISFVIILGTNLGRFIKSGEADFVECFGIMVAIILSASITLFMEGSSEKAFEKLNRIYDNVFVKVIRDGKAELVLQEDVAVGDVVSLAVGDKIVADGRLIESVELLIDESALTGESVPVKKDANAILSEDTPLAERVNSGYSGTFVSGGSGLLCVTKIGDETEIGSIAGELSKKTETASPLQQKLSKLGKTISAIGAVCAVIVFILSITRLIITNSVTFNGVQEAFITSIVLVVAAVPEGLPTIVAVSLALNMIKLAKENALIKKMIATETTGAVSVICSDKTGTLTENKMAVSSVCLSEFCYLPEKLNHSLLLDNFCVNSTADLIRNGKDYAFSGSATECALLVAYNKSTKKDYKVLRQSFKIEKQIPFSSLEKKMTTIVKTDGGYRAYLKGAPEVVLANCNLTEDQRQKVISKILGFERQAKRVIAFAHKELKELNDFQNGFHYDGIAVVSDPIRRDVYQAVKTCKKAGIDIKMLTGDNLITATAIAKELDIISSDSQAVNASVIDGLSEEDLKKLLPKINVIARSTPLTKLKVVKALKSMGQVVAVTGDGINDAPAIKHADVGIAMGIAGSEITKEASDIVLLNDSFTTIVKTISFGRNVYQNLQRFIMFQLSVNLSAVAIIITSLLLGYPAPFNTLELLWINIIMDGPPALTLGLEATDESLMERKPVDRFSSIVSKKMLVKILIHGLYIAVITLLQIKTNFIGAKEEELGAVLFTLFILFQLFNAFNSREMGKKSVFSNLNKNKPMLIVFAITFVLHIIIVEFCYKLFGINPLSFMTFCKIFFVTSSIVVLSELYKLIYRIVAKNGKVNAFFTFNKYKKQQKTINKIKG